MVSSSAFQRADSIVRVLKRMGFSPNRIGSTATGYSDGRWELKVNALRDNQVTTVDLDPETGHLLKKGVVPLSPYSSLRER